jgi:hypothetical protein
MSIGKKSIARAATAAAKAETKTEAVVEAVPVTEEAASAAEADLPVQETPIAEEPKKKTPEKFKKVSVGDGMPAFLL